MGRIVDGQTGKVLDLMHASVRLMVVRVIGLCMLSSPMGKEEFFSMMG